MTDTGSRLAIVPAHLARLFGECDGHDAMIVVDIPLGGPSDAAIRAHAARCLAAGVLLGLWGTRGVRSLRLDGGRLWPELLAPEHVDGAVWAVGDPAAAEVLVATVALGARYRGWRRALVIAEREMAAPEVPDAP